MDYKTYKLSFGEFLGYGCVFMVGAVLAGWLLFARLWLGALMGVLLLPLLFKKLKVFLCGRRKAKLEEEFCRYMQLTVAALTGGTAFDNVFREVADTVSLEKSGRSLMEKEFRIVDRLIGLHYDSTDAFKKFADRTGSQDIQSMAEALNSVQMTGGNVAELLKDGVHAMRLKQDTEREIRRIVALPRMNHKILTGMPFAFLILFRSMSPGYIACLYEGTGLFVMAAVAFLTGSAWLLGDRVGKINI